MSEFNRVFSTELGEAAFSSGSINSAMIKKCYIDTLRITTLVEPPQNSEKWIAMLDNELASIQVDNRSAEQITRSIFERIAKG
jgi:hypothetical protein